MTTWQRHFPLAPMAAPRATRRSWHARARLYKRWRDVVRSFVGPPDAELVPPFSVRIVCLDWHGSMDPDNVAKAVLDALQPWPIPRDNWKHVASVSVCRSSAKVPGGGFHVELETWGGLQAGMPLEGAETAQERRKAAG